MDQKTCTKCNETKSLADFSNGKGYRNGRYAMCKKCRAAHKKVWRYKTGEQRKFLLRSYGLTAESYAARLAAQDGKCAVCGCLPEQSAKGVLAVDHDHATGRVRGLLCGLCNTGIGLLKDNRTFLLRAADYLTGY